MQLDTHPTVQSYRSAAGVAGSRTPPPANLDGQSLRQLCLDLGADDAGFVELERVEIADQRGEILGVFPPTRALISYVVKMNRESVRTPARSISNLEFHRTGDEVNEVGHRIVAALEQRGIRALNVTMAFPMEADRWPRKMWTVSHKPVAVAAGLGQMGIHRSVIHPRFGSFILLGTILIDTPVSEVSSPVDFNPCLECKLCVAACPTGAISPEGGFNFSACYTHNYREFMGGFTDWVETVVESKDRLDYRRQVTDAESVSMWQSLAFGPNYKAAYCLSVCPAGEEVIGPFLTSRTRFLGEVVKPLQAKEETIYAIAGSDAEAYVPTRFPWKRVKRVRSNLRPDSIAGFLGGLRLTFQPGRAAGLDVIYHFRFTGAEPAAATVTIRNGTLQVVPGLEGSPDLAITADSAAWIHFVRRETGLLAALLLGRIKLRGSFRLLPAFGRCFPV